MKPWLAAAAALAISSCLTQKQVPGDPIGNFAFEATLPLEGDSEVGPGTCALAEVPDAGFSFSATFSRDPVTGQAYAEVGGVQRLDTTLEGPLLISTASAPRIFAQCKCEGVTVVETLKVVLLTPEQNRLAQDTCPDHPFDGGLSPDDGGIYPSPATGAAYNAIRACGVLIDVVEPPDGGCGEECPRCELHYRLNGGRR